MTDKYSLQLDMENYVLSIGKHPIEPELDTIELDLDRFDLSGHRINAHRWDGTKLYFDDDRYAEIMRAIEAEQREAERTPSLIDRIESQLLYTSLMTDTLLEE